MSVASPVLYAYRQALAPRGFDGLTAPSAERLSELVALLDLTVAAGIAETSDDMFEAALRIVTGTVRSASGALCVMREDGVPIVLRSHGLPAGADATSAFTDPPADITDVAAGDAAAPPHGLVLLCPVRRRDRTIAVLGVGPRADGEPYDAEARAFLRCAAACAATPIENLLLRDELQRANHQLSVRVFELHNLLDSSRELTGRPEEDAIHGLIATTVMGHFVVSRCAVYLLGPDGLALAHSRGLRRFVDAPAIPREAALSALCALQGPTAVSELPEGPLRRQLEALRLVLAVPLAARDEVKGVLGIGERSSRTPFSSQDRDFAEALGRQAAAALEHARLHRLSMEKQRQDQELKLAREIQRSLLPQSPPVVPGFDIAAVSRSCFEVGGDTYDWVHLGDGRLALVIGDVSGKGTPASLLMASVQASVQVLAGAAGAASIVERLNRFLVARTEASRYVTLFYAELATSTRELAYVNAGHVPPYCVTRDGLVRRLRAGGLALGLFEEATYEVGTLTLEPGDVVAMVTDGVTEAAGADEREFGDARVCEVLRAGARESAAGILGGLVTAVDTWVGATGSSDDLTALVLKAR
jgi:sigma-B regulation protein RsbU (phosphoserine phosphatase)